MPNYGHNYNGPDTRYTYQADGPRQHSYQHGIRQQQPQYSVMPQQYYNIVCVKPVHPTSQLQTSLPMRSPIPQYYPQNAVYMQPQQAYYQPQLFMQYPTVPPNNSQVMTPSYLSNIPSTTQPQIPVPTAASSQPKSDPPKQRERRILNIFNPETNEQVSLSEHAHKVESSDVPDPPPLNSTTVNDPLVEETRPKSGAGESMIREVHKRAMSEENSLPSVTDSVIVSVDENEIESKDFTAPVTTDGVIETQEEGDSEEIDQKYSFHPDPKESEQSAARRKLQYDRKFLIKQQQSSLSLIKPINMPATLSDIVFDKPNKETQYSPVDVADFTPSFANYNRGQQSNYQQKGVNRQYSSGNKRRGRSPPTPTPKRIIETPQRQKEELKRSESAYVPNFIAKCEGSETNGIGEKDLSRQIRAVLNRVTPQNFTHCMDQISDLSIGTEHGLTILIDTLFDKAVKEEAYSVTFAQMCKNMEMIKVVTETGVQKTFKTLLLTRCQKMFETPLTTQLENVGISWDKRVEDEKIASIKRMLSEDKEEQIKKAKDKYYGNIRFIGELFLQKILSEKVILRCIEQLLGNKEPESLESLCKLLETTGSKLDAISTTETKMRTCFSQISKIVEADKIETRLKYKLMDIVEMRSRKWVLRKIQEQRQIRPMTKTELAEEEVKKQREKEIELRECNEARKQQGPSDRRVSSGPNAQTGLRLPKPAAAPINPSKLALSEATGTADFKLGPGGGMSLWSKGSGNKKEKKGDSEWKSVGGSSRNTSKSSREASRSLDASPRPSQKTPAASITLPPDVLSKDELTDDAREILVTKSEHIVTEFIQTGHIDKEVFIKVASNLEVFLDALLNHMLDRDVITREKTGALFYFLLKQNLMSIKQLVEGLCSFLSNAEELITDCPGLWQCIADCLQMLIQEDTTNIGYFVEMLDPLITIGKAGVVLSKTLHMAANRLSNKTFVGELFLNSDLNWTVFVTENISLAKFVQVNELQFTLTDTMADSIELSETEDKFRLQLASEKFDVDKTLKEIDSTVDKTTLSSVKFFKLVCRLVFEGAINVDSGEVDASWLEDRAQLIQNLVRRSDIWEIEVLYTLQKVLMGVKEEQDFISIAETVFDVLTNNQIISQDAILSWDSLSDPETKEGYERTKKAVQTHLAFLKN